MEDSAQNKLQVPHPRIAHHPGKTSTRMRSSAFLTCADYRILDFSLIMSPSTANLPYPLWLMVFGSFCAGSVQALSTSRMKRLYLLTRRVSATLHSRLAKHSATRGGATRWAGVGVSPNLSNFSTSRPEQLPTSTTLDASSSAGTAITHSLVTRNAAKL